MIGRELHELTALRDLVLQGDVQQDGAEESSKGNDETRGRCKECSAEFIIIENFSHQEMCQKRLAADKECCLTNGIDSLSAPIFM